MGDLENEVTIRRLWDFFEARQWDEARRLFADDAVVTWPHRRERFRSAENFIAMTRAYPGAWSISVNRLVSKGDLAVSEITVTLGDLHFRAASFFELRGGRSQVRRDTGSTRARRIRRRGVRASPNDGLASGFDGFGETSHKVHFPCRF